jgi:hypothetical protein
LAEFSFLKIQEKTKEKKEEKYRERDMYCGEKCVLPKQDDRTTAATNCKGSK